NNPVLPTLTALVLGVTGLAAFLAAAWPHRRLAGVAAPALALALVGLALVRESAGLEGRARFPGPHLARAQATFAAAVAPRAVVITTEEVGRPAENIEYYSGVAHALYLTDLQRWRLPIWRAATLLANHGFVPYLLLPAADPGREQMIAELENHFDVD